MDFPQVNRNSKTQVRIRLLCLGIPEKNLQSLKINEFVTLF